MAQSIQGLTLDFSSGHDLMMGETEAQVGLRADSADPAWDSLFLSLSLCASLHPLNQSINQSINK